MFAGKANATRLTSTVNHSINAVREMNGFNKISSLLGPQIVNEL